jgi:hypothetical protein
MKLAIDDLETETRSLEEIIESPTIVPTERTPEAEIEQAA